MGLTTLLARDPRVARNQPGVLVETYGEHST